MAEYIEREVVVDLIQQYANGDVKVEEAFLLPDLLGDITDVPAADVQPNKKSQWQPPLMGQGKCETYCGRCFGKIMRNSTGIFEETPFCPHCGARMDGEQQ